MKSHSVDSLIDMLEVDMSDRRVQTGGEETECEELYGEDQDRAETGLAIVLCFPR